MRRRLAAAAAVALLAAAPAHGAPVAEPDAVSPHAARTTPPAIRLPEGLGPWHLSGEPRRHDERTIFDYMDGAGEIFVGYRFAGLDLFEYAAEDGEPIIVEIFRMRSSDDAFGLLSLDWSGAPDASFASPDSLSRSLFSDGSLRVWSGDLFVRILPYDPTPASEKAARAIGRAISEGREDPPPPALVRAALSREAPPLRPGSLRFVRTHPVLNSVYFLDARNVLDLERSSEVVVGEMEDGARVLFVRYADAEAARRAIARFREEALGEPSDAPLASAGAARLAERWCGWRVEGRAAAFVFTEADSLGLADRVARAIGAAAGAQ